MQYRRLYAVGDQSFYRVCIAATLHRFAAAWRQRTMRFLSRCLSYQYRLAYVLLVGLAFALIHVATASETDVEKGGALIELTGPSGERWPVNVTLHNVETGQEQTYASGLGRVITRMIPVGTYRTYIRALWQQVWYVVDIQDIEIRANDVVTLKSSFVEGGGRIGLPVFDTDFDGVIDAAERKLGTDPMDATDIPGVPRLEFDQRVLKKQEGWYRGELRCYSTYSESKLRVSDIIRQAEKIGLDFIAITDKKTLEHCKDPDYKSDKVVVIPAFEWGMDGHATCLGAKTMIENWDTNAQVQAAIQLAHAQGVIFNITDPCSPKNPWEWTVGGFHAMEVWSHKWRSEPGTTPEALRQGERTKHIYATKEMQTSLALEGICKNAQALDFYDAVLRQKQRTTPVGGSGAFDRLGDIGSPVTYVYAPELSAQGILAGIFNGYTFVSSGIDGPRLLFMADVEADKKIEGIQGSVIPIVSASANDAVVVKPIKFHVGIENLKETGTVKLNVIKNGTLWRTQEIDPATPVYDFTDQPPEPSYYRIELVRTVDDQKAQTGFGGIEMLALASPIYADWIPVTDIPLGVPQDLIRVSEPPATTPH